MLTPVLSAYGFSPQACTLAPFGSGLINNTWELTHQSKRYILQRINQEVFKQPEAIAENISLVADHVSANKDYFFVRPELTTEGRPYFYSSEGDCFRLFPFVAGSHTIDVVSTPGQAYEAALQFGRFTMRLRKLDTNRLRITLHGFHNLSLRYSQFESALKSGHPERLQKAAGLTGYLTGQHYLVDIYNNIVSDPSFKKRVTHHDTKISNVLFDEHDRGICVIDLDTVMPGYFISDVGDMMRTYLSPVSEEEKDTSKISIRDTYFFSIARGYLQEMQGELTKEEKEQFVYAGKFMIYMQALRFATDYLNNDSYYGARYEGHNLARAENQAILLERLTAAESRLKEITGEILGAPVTHRT